MSDLISRQAAIDAVKTYWKKVVDDIPKGVGFEELTQLCNMALEHNANILKAIDQLPSAQPERKTGHWIKTARWGRVYYCDQCRNYLDFDGVNVGRGSTNFCPNCGAKMDGERSE